MEWNRMGVTKIGILIAIVLFSACYNMKYPKTNEKFLNETKVPEDNYNKDIEYLIKSVEFLIQDNIAPFDPPNQFDSETEIEIDTILYSPNELKMVAFIVTKNANSKNPYMRRPPGFHYNECFLYGIRGNKDSIWNLIPSEKFVMKYYKNKRDMSDRFHNHSFREMAKTSYWQYNLNDIRFWNGSIWEALDDKKSYLFPPDNSSMHE